jgi:hypothetical protein
MKPYIPPLGRFLGDVMNNFGGGVGQGSDLVLYNAFDWEHLRKRFVALPGIARSARMAAGRRPKDTAAALQAFFANEPEINVESPGKSLLARPGHAWRWTSTGFMPEKAAKSSKSKSSIGGGVDDIRAWLAGIGVKQAYAPFADRPLSLIVNPEAPVTVHTKAFEEALQWTEGKPPRRRG